MAENLIGPLTAAEWCSFRLRDDEDEDFLVCCAVTSNFRDEVFHLLRMGGGKDDYSRYDSFRAAYWDMVAHPFPEGPGAELIDRLAKYYLGAPPATREEHDDWTAADFTGSIRRRQTARDSGALHTDQRISRYTIDTMPDDYAGQHMWQVHAERYRSDQWMVTRDGMLAGRNGVWRPRSPIGIEPEDYLMTRQEALELAHQLAPQVVNAFGQPATEFFAMLMEVRRG